MLSHIAKDLYESYLTEMEPQLGKKQEGGEGGSAVASPDEASAKRIRQAVYDIRYRARREDIDVSQAYSQYMSNTSMAANEKSAVRDKLGLGPGGQAEGFEMDEDAKAGEHYLRVTPQRGTGEKEYVRKFDPQNPSHRAKRHSLEKRGIKATVTKHGNPYDQDHSGAGEKYEKQYGPSNGKNTVGDKDKDGTVEPDGHEYAGVKDNAIKKATAKKGVKKESYSSWRDEIREVVEKANAIKERDQQIKEKTIKNNIIVNPDVPIKEFAHNLGGKLVETVDLGEDFEELIADYATEYFFLEGLNENGIDILIEDLGADEFVDYVFDLFEEFEEEILTEARRSGRIEPITKTGKDVGSLKGGAKAAAIKRLRAEKQSRRDAEAAASAERPSKLTSSLKSQSERAKVAKGLKKASTEKKVEKAKETQAPAANKSSEGTKKEVKKGILGAIKDRAARDTELLKKSWKTARDAGKSAEKRVASAAGTAAGAAVGAAKVVHRAGQEAGKSEAGQKVKATLAKAGKAAVAGASAGARSGENNTAAGRAGRAVGTFVKKMKEDYEFWVEELIDEGYDVWEYSEDYLIETYLPEDLDEGLGSALRGILSPNPSERQKLAKERLAKHAEATKTGGISPYSPQRKSPSTPIKKPNTPERDPWSGNPETDKAWAKGKSASKPYAYQGTHEEFEEWLEGILEEGIELDENMLFLLYESTLTDEMVMIAESSHVKKDGVDDNGNTSCWKGYVKKGTKIKGGKEVNNCVKAEDTKLDNIIAQIRGSHQVDEAAPVIAAAGRLAMRALTSKTAQKAAKKVGKAAVRGAAAGAAERAGEVAYDTTRNIGKKNTECEEYVSELNRYEKETGTSSGSLNMPKGKPTQKGGDSDPAMRFVRQSMRRQSGKPVGQQKKERGKKPPVAGEYGSERRSPAQTVANRRAAAQKAQDSMSSRFD
jgi:hypothetical protein